MFEHVSSERFIYQKLRWMRKVIEPQQERLASAVWPAALMLLGSFLAVGWLQYRPVRSDAPVLGVFSPFAGADAATRAAAAAGANIVAPSPVPFALIVQSDDPEFFVRMRRAGAWLLFDATGRGLCGGVERLTRQS